MDALYQKILSLSLTRRYPGTPVYPEQSVAEHILNATLLVLSFLVWLSKEHPDVQKAVREKYPGLLPSKLLLGILTHDLDEIVLSDIPYPTKKMMDNSALDTIVRDILPEPLLTLYRGYMRMSGKERLLVSVFDMLELVLFLRNSLSLRAEQARQIYSRGYDILRGRVKKVCSVYPELCGPLDEFIGLRLGEMRK